MSFHARMLLAIGLLAGLGLVWTVWFERWEARKGLGRKAAGGDASGGDWLFGDGHHCGDGDSGGDAGGD